MAAERKPQLRVTCPLELVALLRAGDRLAYCQGSGWRLVGGAAAVDARGGHVPLPEVLRGGRLAPLGDALLPGHPAQTWAWAEGRSHARH